MLTSEQRELLRRHVSIDGDGNVVGNDSTVHVTKQAAGDYVVQIGEQRIAVTVEDLRRVLHIEQSQVGVVGDGSIVHGGIHFHTDPSATGGQRNYFERLQRVDPADLLRQHVESVLDNNIASILVAILATALAGIGIVTCHKGLRSVPVAAWAIAGIVLLVVTFMVIVAERWHESRKGFKATISVLNAINPLEFVGRKKELASFRQVLQGESKQSLISVFGPPGIGKSWLLNRFVYEARQIGVKWAKIDFRNRSYEMLYMLEDIQSQIGSKWFPEFIDAFDAYTRARQQVAQRAIPPTSEQRELLTHTERKALHAFAQDLHRLTSQETVLLLFDTFENVEKTSISTYLEDLLKPMTVKSGPTRCVVVVGGWHCLKWHNGWETIMSPCELDYFTVDEVRKRLAIESNIVVKERLAEAVHEYTNGHPLAVGLAATLLEKASVEDEKVSAEIFDGEKRDLQNKLVVTFLTERIQERLDPDIARLVRLCSIPRWFDAGLVRVFIEDREKARRSFNQLIGYRAFIQPHFPLGYEYHSILRNLFLGKWQQEDPEGYAELNRVVLDHLLSRRAKASGVLEDTFTLDIVHHSLVESEERGMAALLQYFREALRSYRLDFCETLIEEAEDFSPLLPRYQMEVEYRKSQVLLARELWRDAQNILESLTPQVSRLFEETRGGTLASLVYYDLGNLFARKSENQQAIQLYETSLAFLDLEEQEEHPDEINPADILIDLGLAQMVLGRLSEAENSLQRAERLITKVGRSTSRLLLHQEILYLSRGEWKKAIETHERFVQLPPRFVDQIDRIRDSYHLGESLMRLGKLEEAKSIFERNYEAAQRIPNPYRRFFARLGIARVLEQQREWEKSIDQFERAITLYAELGADLAAQSYRTEQGRVLFKARRIKAARERLEMGTKAARALGHTAVIGEASIYLGALDALEGNCGEALQHFELAVEKFTQFGYVYQRILAMTYFLRYCHEHLSHKVVTNSLAEAIATASNNTYYDLLAVLYCVEGEVRLRRSQCHQVAEVSQLYAKACHTATLHNQYCLDLIIEIVGETLTNVAHSGHTDAALEICERLMRSGKEEDLNLVGMRGREREQRKGIPQTELVERIKQIRASLPN